MLAPHGVRGELKCRIVTDFPKQRFKRGNTLVIDGVPHTVQSARVNGNVVLLKLVDVPDREAAETYRNREIQVATEEAVHLPKGQFYWHQVIGLTVEDATTHAVLGTVADILETGANDVYIVKDERGRELLVPAIKDVVKDIDPSNGKMVIAPLPGMIAR